MDKMISQKSYGLDCGGPNGLQGPSTPSPQPTYLMPSAYGSVNVSCAQFGSPNCMSPSSAMNSYTTMGSPSGGAQYMGGGPGGGGSGGSVYNGLNGLNSGSCDNLTVSGGPSPGQRGSGGGPYRDSSVLNGGGGGGPAGVNSAAAAAAVAANLKPYRRSYTHAKPPYSYISLITMAIQVKLSCLFVIS